MKSEAGPVFLEGATVRSVLKTYPHTYRYCIPLQILPSVE